MISAPHLSYATLAPLIFVFGAACIGVLIEAFVPRESRQPVQIGVALVGTVGAFVSTILLHGHHPEVTAGGALAVDGAGLFLQATIAGLGPWPSCCSPSAPSTPPGRRSSPRPRCRPAARATGSC